MQVAGTLACCSFVSELRDDAFSFSSPYLLMLAVGAFLTCVSHVSELDAFPSSFFVRVVACFDSVQEILDPL